MAFAVGTRFALAGGFCVAVVGIVADPSAGTVDPRGQSDSAIANDALIMRVVQAGSMVLT